MSNKLVKSPLSIAVSAALSVSVACIPSVNADQNPFAMKELNSGYMQFAEGKCGESKGKEGKCGEGKCGESKGKEGKCGEGKCGESKAKEGKCGEGKCGS